MSLLTVLAKAAAHAAADTAHPHDAHNTHLHEGRLGQPGVPGGPRNHFDGFTPPPTISPTGQVTGGVLGAPAGSVAPPPESLHLAALEAEHGRAPTVGPGSLVHLWNPTPEGRAKGNSVLHQLEQVALGNLKQHENITADPIAEALINFAATAGIGAGVSALKGGAELGAAELGAAGASDAAGSAEAPSVADRLLKAATAVKRAPTAVREAPSAALDALGTLATKEGAQAAAARAGGTAAEQILEHPRYAQVGGLGAVGAVTGKKEGGLQIPSALVQGTAAALDPTAGDYFGEHDVNTAVATARGLAGAVAAPAALGYSAIDSAVHGDPSAFLKTASGQGEGILEILGKLASGNPQTVQDATENEVGLSFLPLLPALHDSGLYTDRVREPIRRAANDARGAVNDALGTDRLRHVAPELQNGGAPNVFGFFENRQGRRQVAEDAQFQTGGDNLIGAHHALDTAKEARALPDSRGLRNLRRPLTTEDLLSTLGEYGISDPAHVGLVRDHGPTPRPPEARLKGEVDIGAVLGKLAEDPSIVSHPKVRQLLEKAVAREADSPIARAGEGRRAKYAGQASLLGVQDAVDRVPMATRKFTDATDRAGAWDDLQKSEATARNLRVEARRALALANDVVGGDPLERPLHQRLAEDNVHPDAAVKAGQLRDTARNLYDQARALEKHNKAFRSSLDKYTRPGAAVSSRARRKLWDPQLLDEMVEETKAKAADPAAALGQEPGSIPALAEPVYSHHAELRDIGQEVGTKGASTKATSVQHVRRFANDPASLAFRDQVDRSFKSFVQGTYRDPYKRAGLQKFNRDFFSKNHIQLEVERDGKAAKKGLVTKAEFNDARAGGKLSRQYVWVPVADYREPFRTAGTLENADQARTAKEVAAHDARKKTEGPRGLVVLKSKYDEYQAQVDPPKWLAERFVNGASRTAGAILLMSPAWVASQTIAELLPMLMADPRLAVNPAKWVQLHKAIAEQRDVDPRAARLWSAVAGEGEPRMIGTRQQAPGYQPAHSDFADFPRALEHNPAVRALFHTVKGDPLFMFDRWRQTKYREILAAAKVDKDLNSFWAALRGAVTKQARLSDELKGLPLEEAMRKITTDPHYAPYMREIHDYVNDIQGNWHAFTKYERQFAPLSVFYAFIRYAFRWPLAFARNHPVSATVNYFLAQQNANQIEKLLGGHKPVTFAQFADPVVTGVDGKQSVLPLGTRITPGLSGPSQGVLEGSVPQAAIGSLNPLLGALVSTVTGVDNFGQQHSGEDEPLVLGAHLSLGAKALMSTPPLLRFLGVGESHSQTAEELHANDPNRKVRSFIDPALPESGKGFRANNEIIESIEQYESEKQANGGFPPSSSSSGLGGFGASSSSSAFDSFGGGSSSNAFDGF